MIHTDGIAVWLMHKHGNELQQHDIRDVSHFGEVTGKAQSSTIHETPGAAFRVCIKFVEDFDLGGAEGVKVVIAVGRTQQEEDKMTDVQAWYLRGYGGPGGIISKRRRVANVPIIGMDPEETHDFSIFRSWDEDGQSLDNIAFEMLHPDGTLSYKSYMYHGS